VSRYKHSSEGSLPLLFACRPPHVDDDEIICRLGTTILQSQGYEVLCAKDGFEGLAALKQSLPDVIISDLQMPKMNGFEFLSVVRKRFPQIPIIAALGRENPDSPVHWQLLRVHRPTPRSQHHSMDPHHVRGRPDHENPNARPRRQEQPSR
jgi:CheY-like chemotaxis protein